MALPPLRLANPQLESLLDRDETHDEFCACCLEPWGDFDHILRHTTCKHDWHDRCIQAWLREAATPTCPMCRATINPVQRYDCGDFDWKRYWRQWTADRLDGESEEEFLARPGRRVQHEYRTGLEAARAQLYHEPLREAVRVYDQQIAQSRTEKDNRLRRIERERLRLIRETRTQAIRRPLAERHLPRVSVILATLDINESAWRLREQTEEKYENRLLEIEQAWKDKLEMAGQVYRQKRDELIQTRQAAIQSERRQSELWFDSYMYPKLPLLRIEPGKEERFRPDTPY